MNFKNFTLIIIIMCTFLRTYAQEHAKAASHLYVTPLHMTLGIAEEVPGYHIGLGYERVLKNNKWSVHLPITVGSLNTYIISDYYRHGYNMYFSPGIGYYPKGYTGRNKYHLSALALIGLSDYKLLTDYSTGHYNVIYSGLLVNAQYNIPITNRTTIISRLGTGLRIAETKSNYRIWHESPSTYIESTKIKAYGLLNMNIGLQFRL